MMKCLISSCLEYTQYHQFILSGIIVHPNESLQMISNSLFSYEVNDHTWIESIDSHQDQRKHYG